MFSGTGSARNYFLFIWSSLFQQTLTDSISNSGWWADTNIPVTVNYRHLPVGFEHQRQLTLVEQRAASSMGRRDSGIVPRASTWDSCARERVAPVRSNTSISVGARQIAVNPQDKSKTRAYSDEL